MQEDRRSSVGLYRRGRAGWIPLGWALLGVMGSWFLANSVLAGETLSDVPSNGFVARQLDSDLAPNQDYSPARRVHFGKLLIRRSEGTVSALLANETRSRSLPGDVTDPDVSYDATRVVFSGYSDKERAWRIWEIDEVRAPRLAGDR